MVYTLCINLYLNLQHAVDRLQGVTHNLISLSSLQEVLEGRHDPGAGGEGRLLHLVQVVHFLLPGLLSLARTRSRLSSNVAGPLASDTLLSTTRGFLICSIWSLLFTGRLLRDRFRLLMKDAAGHLIV